MRLAASRFVVALGVSIFLSPPVQVAECTGTRYECALTYVEHQNQAAIQSLTAELQQQPQNLNALNLLGIALTGAGHPQKAAATFKQALIVDPHFYPAGNNLAINESDLKHFGEAEIQFNRVLKDAPGDEIAHLYLGEISFGKKDLAAAANHYEAGRKRIGLKAPWILHYADCPLTKNNVSQVVTLSPGFIEAHYQLGLALRQSADGSAKAESAFREVLLLDPNHAPAHLQLGLLLAADGDRAEAAAEFENAAKLAPGLVEARRELGRLATDSRDWETAVRQFQAVVAWNPQDAAAHYDPAASLNASGQLDEAARELQIAQKLDPKFSAPR
jgi:protein O-GlcNAc transferase